MLGNSPIRRMINVSEPYETKGMPYIDSKEKHLVTSPARCTKLKMRRALSSGVLKHVEMVHDPSASEHTTE